jgi:hypothetical protein
LFPSKLSATEHLCRIVTNKLAPVMMTNATQGIDALKHEEGSSREDDRPMIYQARS